VSTPRVVEAGLRGFACLYSGYVESPYALGQLVAVREGSQVVLGVVADCQSGPEDPSRPLQHRGAAGASAAQVMADNPEIRLLLRTRLTVVTCGFIDGEAARPVLPPTPPPLLAEVDTATTDETVRIAAEGAFLALLVNAPACDDEVIAAAIRSAARAFPGPEARQFTVAAGKELARLLKAEPSRLGTIIRSVGA
jgi:hypothetical protein